MRGRTAAALLALLLGALAAPARAQGLAERLRVGGEVAVGSELAVLPDGTTEVRARYAVRIDAGLDLSPVALELVAEPTVLVPDPVPGGPPGARAPLLSAGVETLALSGSAGSVDLSLGLERLALSEARLLGVATLEPNDELGRPRGLPNVRATLFAGDWRVRAALLSDAALPWEDPLRASFAVGALAGVRTVPNPLDGDDLGGALSVRRASSELGLEAHAAWLRGLSLGLTGNGLLGEVVVYGDAWLLADPWRARALLGASGYLGAALWTAELGLAPIAGGRDAPAAPRLAGSLDLPLELGDDAGTLGAVAGATLLEPRLGDGGDALRLALAAALELRIDRFEGSLALRPFARVAGEDVSGGATFELRVFY